MDGFAWEEVRKEVETSYLHSIVSIMENKKLPKSMVINLDQTPSKNVAQVATKHWYQKEPKESQ